MLKLSMKNNAANVIWDWLNILLTWLFKLFYYVLKYEILERLNIDCLKKMEILCSGKVEWDILTSTGTLDPQLFLSNEIQKNHQMFEKCFCFDGTKYFDVIGFHQKNVWTALVTYSVVLCHLCWRKGKGRAAAWHAQCRCAPSSSSVDRRGMC